MIIREDFFPYYKNHELILDLTLGAFSIYDISGLRDDHVPALVDYFIYPEHTVETHQREVVDNDGVVVTDANGIVVTSTVTTAVIQSFHPREEIVTFLYIGHEWNYSYSTFFGFSRYINQSFRDWDNIIEDAGGWYGFSYVSYMVTGYNLTGDMARQGQSIYLQTFCRRTENYYLWSSTEFDRPSACWVSSRWEWNEDNTQGKWGSEFNAYRFTKPTPTSTNYGDPFTYGDTVITTKNKLRGRGHDLAIMFDAELNKDLRLLGWNALMTKNGEP